MAKKKKRVKASAPEQARQMIKNFIVTILLVTVLLAGMAAAGYRNVGYYTLIMIIPGIIVMLIDWRQGRYASRAIMIFNLAGLVPQLIAILSSGSPNNIAINQIQVMPRPALVPWLAAAFGWSVVYLFPKIVQLFLEVRAEYIIMNLEKRQSQMLSEWGDDIKKFIPKVIADKNNPN